MNPIHETSRELAQSPIQPSKSNNCNSNNNINNNNQNEDEVTNSQIINPQSFQNDLLSKPSEINQINQLLLSPNPSQENTTPNLNTNSNQNQNNQNPPIRDDSNVPKAIPKTLIDNQTNTSNTDDNYKIDIKNVLEDKKKLIDTLRKEMLTVEQQRNYIEILKESLNNNLINIGLDSVLKNNNKYISKDDKLVDLFVDFIKNRKKKSEDEIKINELNEIIKNNNITIDNLNLKTNELINLNINLNSNLEKEKNNFITLQKEKVKCDDNLKELNDNLNNIIKENIKLNDEKNECDRLIKEQEGIIIKNNNQINNQTNELSNYKNIQNETNKIKVENDYYKKQNETLQKEISILNKKLDQFKSQGTNIQNVTQNSPKKSQLITPIATENDAKNDDNNEENKYNEDNNIKILELNNTIRQKDNELFELNEAYNNIKNEKDTLIYLKETAEKKLIESTNNFNNLKNAFDKNKIENENLLDKIEKIKIENSDLVKDNSDLNKKIQLISNEHNAILISHYEKQNEINNSIAQQSILNKKIIHWKSKYEELSNSKDQEIKDLLKNILTYKNKLIELENDNKKLAQYNYQIDQKFKGKILNEQKLINDRDKYKYLYNNLNKKYEQNLTEMNTEINSSNDLINKNYELESQLTSLIEMQNNDKNNKMEIINELNDIKNSIKNIFNVLSDAVNKYNSDEYLNNLSINFRKFIINFNPKTRSHKKIEEFIYLSLNEINLLNEEIFKNKQNIENLSNNFTLNEKEIKEKSINEIEKLRDVITNLRNICDKNNIEISTKDEENNKMLNEINNIKEQNKLIIFQKEYLEAILLRLCKMLPNPNLFHFTKSIIEPKILIEDKEKLNQNLLYELKRVDDYLKKVREIMNINEDLNPNFNMNLDNKNKENVNDNYYNQLYENSNFGCSCISQDDISNRKDNLTYQMTQ